MCHDFKKEHGHNYGVKKGLEVSLYLPSKVGRGPILQEQGDANKVYLVTGNSRDADSHATPIPLPFQNPLRYGKLMSHVLGVPGESPHLESPL